MLFSSHSVCKTAKEPPNNIPESMIGYAQTPRKIHEYSI